MQKLIETLKEYGVTIPDDKQADIKTALSKYYKNIAEHEKVIGKIERERDAYKERAESAEATLKGFGDKSPDEIKNELATALKRAEDAEKHAQAQIDERDFADALKTELESVKFSSEAAKRDVMSQIKAAGLKLKDGKILGLSDLIGQIKQSDASAFVDEQKEALEAGKARFTDKLAANTQASGAGLTARSDIGGIKDRGERRAAIVANLKAGVYDKPAE